jgi:hypothetical protein
MGEAGTGFPMADRSHAPSAQPLESPRSEPVLSAAIAAAALGLVAYLGFDAGGFFPDTTAAGVVALLLVLVVLATSAPHPGAAVRARLVVAVVALALFALWELASASWSHAPGRAALAANLTMLYVVALAAGGLVAGRGGRARALVLGLLGAMVVICVAGLLSRTLPHVFPVAADTANDRLGFPLTYWNAMGIVGAVATIMCVGLTSSAEERPAVRVAAAAAVPALTATVLFTFSRGAIAAGTIGLVLAIALAPRRHLLPGLLAVVSPAVIAVVVAYHADALATADPATPAAVHQGHRVILVVAVTTVVAGALRALLIRVLDRRLDSRSPLPARTTAAIGAGVVVVALAAAVALSAPGRIAHAYDRFVHGSAIHSRTDERARLTDPSNNGRLDHWRVALDGFRDQPLHGTGAGTYQNLWNLHRRDEFDVLNAHSLYLETLGETGVVGLVLLAAALLALLAGALARLRGPDRALWATVAAAMVAWLLEAGVDWVWQMPAASLWLFAIGGAALARPARAVPATQRGPGRTARLVAGVAILLAAISPVRVGLSQLHLRDAVADLQRGDCRGAVDAALASAQALGTRSEPYELLGYCDARLGYGPLSIAMVNRAIEHDPGNWEYRYDLALVRAAAGRDPRPAIAAARRRNPLSGLLIRTSGSMATNDPRTWRRRAVAARLLLPQR